ncbi:hypothetical protein MRX96_032192 [Rhipicephalus microplus]
MAEAPSRGASAGELHLSPWHSFFVCVLSTAHEFVPPASCVYDVVVVVAAWRKRQQPRCWECAVRPRAKAVSPAARPLQPHPFFFCRSEEDKRRQCRRQQRSIGSKTILTLTGLSEKRGFLSSVVF